MGAVKVRIQNFQSIRDLSFTIDRYTAITGKTNIGKSAIMRAISNAILNKSVVGLVRRGSKFCTVEMYCDTWGFRWEKGTGVGRYTWLDPNGQPILGPDGHPKMLDKVGQGQLQELVAIGFGSVEIGNESLQPWFASQFSPVFLLNKTGPAVTDFFSEVAHLRVLQDGVILSVRNRKRSNDQADEKDAEIKKLQESVSKFSGLDPLLRLNDELDGQLSSICQYETRASKAVEIQQVLILIGRKIEVLSQRVEVPRGINQDVVLKLVSMHRHWTSMESTASKARVFRPVQKVAMPAGPEIELKRMEQLNKYSTLASLQAKVEILSNSEKLDVQAPQSLAKPFQKLRTVSQLHNVIQVLQERQTTLSTPLNVPVMDCEPGKLKKSAVSSMRIEQLRDLIRTKEQSVKKISRDLSGVSKELALIPNCALCGRPSPMTHQHQSHSA